MSDSLLCWNCGTSLEDTPLPISRHSNCPKCFEVLHCCRLCLNYAPGRPSDCDHERADPPVIKEGVNFCEYFKPNKDAYNPTTKANQQTAGTEFDALFGNDANANGTTEPASQQPSQPDSGQSLLDAARSQNENPLDDLFDD